MPAFTPSPEIMLSLSEQAVKIKRDYENTQLVSRLELPQHHAVYNQAQNVDNRHGITAPRVLSSGLHDLRQTPWIENPGLANYVGEGDRTYYRLTRDLILGEVLLQAYQLSLRVTIPDPVREAAVCEQETEVAFINVPVTFRIFGSVISGAMFRGVASEKIGKEFPALRQGTDSFKDISDTLAFMASAAISLGTAD